MRNLELGLGARPVARPARAAFPALPWTPGTQLVLASTVLIGLLAFTVVMGHAGVAAIATIMIGLAWLTHGRDGILGSALVGLGSIPYLLLVVLAGSAG